MDCTQVLESDVAESQAYTFKVKVAELRVNNDAIPIYSGSNRIGRDPEFCSVVFNNMTLSKEHAVIEVENRYSHLIYDLGSKNKTKLGKMLLKPHVRYQLMDKAQVQFGDLIVDYIMLSDEDGKNSVMDDSDDDLIPGTPAHGKSKDSTSSREDSPTIFQMETECPIGYEETCTRVVKDTNDCEGDLIETDVPAEEYQPTSPVATTNDMNNIAETCSAAVVVPVEEERKETCEDNCSTHVNEHSDGDETDPEDIFNEIKQPTENCVSIAEVEDKSDAGGKECVENTSVENVSLAEDSDDINSPVEELSEIRSRSEPENENETTNSKEIEEEEEEIFCMATQVIANESVQDQYEEGKVVDETIDEEMAEKAEENLVSVSETNNADESVIEPVIQDVCSKDNDDDVFKVPQAVEKTTKEILQLERSNNELKTEKVVESCISAEDEADKDEIFNSATQVIVTETKDADSFEEMLAVERENKQGTEITKDRKKICDENVEENIITNDTNQEECCEEESFPYDVETQVISITQNNKVNSLETTTKADDEHDQIEEIAQDVEKKQNSDKESDGDRGSEADEEGTFAGNADAQADHPEVASEGEEEECCESSAQDSRPPFNDEKIVDENEKPMENLPDENESIFDAETQIVVANKVDSSNVPSTKEKENKELDKEIVEGNECPEEVMGGESIDAAQMGHSREGGWKPQNEEEFEKETEIYIGSNSEEKGLIESLETMESNSVINVEDEDVSKTPKDVQSLKEGFDAFKVPNTVKKKCVDFIDVPSKGAEGDKKNSNDDKLEELHNDMEGETEAIFEAETEVFEIQNEKLNEEPENSEVKHEKITVSNGKTEAIDIKKDSSSSSALVLSKDEQQSNKANDEEELIFDAETQRIPISSKESNTINASEESNPKSPRDFMKSTEKKKSESDQVISSTEKSQKNTSASHDSINVQSSALDDSDDIIFCAPTQVISKSNISNKSVESIISNDKTNKDTPASKEPDSIHSSELDDSDDSMFSAPTQVISKTNSDSVAPSHEDTNKKQLSLSQDSDSCESKENSIRKSSDVDAEKGGEKSSKETHEESSSTVQEIEDNPTNEDEFNDPFFDAPTQIFPSSGLSTSQEEAQDQIKNILNRLENEDDDDDDDEPNNPSKSPPETKKDSDVQETQDTSGSENVNNSFFEAATQIVSFNTLDEKNPLDKEENKAAPTNLSRSSSYDSIHEAATQCIDDLEISGQNLPVVGKSVANSIPLQSSSKMDKESEENLEGSLGDESLQVQKRINASTPVNTNRTLELILPSTQELKKVGEERYGAASDSESPTTSNDPSSPIVQKRTRNRVVARRGILVAKDLETVKPVGARVSFSNISGLPSSSKTELSSEIDGKVSEPIVTTSRRRLRISTKKIVKKPNQLEDVSAKNESENDKSKKQPSRKSVRKGNETEDASSEKKADEEASKLSRNDDKKSAREVRSRAVKESSHPEDNTELNNDLETGSRPSRHRKMTWKARESQEESQSPDSKGKKDEKNESLAVSPTSSTKTKSHDPLPCNANEARTKRVRERSMKENSFDSNTKSKPANKEVLPDVPEDSNVLHREKEMKDLASSPANKEKKTSIEKKGSKRKGKSTSSSKTESKTDSKKGQTTLEKWCGSPTATTKHKKDDINLSLESEKKKGEELSTRSRSRFSGKLNNSSDSLTELKTRNSVVQSKRKQDVDISETLKKQRRTRIALSSDRDIENKPVTSISLLEVNDLPDSNPISKIRNNAIRKPILESSVRSVEKRRSSSMVSAPPDVKEEPSQRGRIRRSMRGSDASNSNTELKPTGSQTQVEKEENPKASHPTNRQRTTRSASSSSDQDKKVEETKRGRSKRSSAISSATIPEVISKPGGAAESKRKQDLIICETPKKQRKTSNVSHDDPPENVNMKSRSKSKRNTGKSNVFGSDSDSKVADEDSSQDVLFLPSPRNRRKARVTLPIVNQNETEDSNKKGRSKRSTTVGNSEVLKQESKSGNSATRTLELLWTPPRSGRNRNASRQPLPSEQKAEQSRGTKRTSKQAPLAESDSSVCGSPTVGSAGRKRKLQVFASSNESDGQSSQGEGTPKRSSRLKNQMVHQIMFTGVACSDDDEAVIKKLGGKVVQEPEECSILITDKIRRTLKFLCTVGQGKPIVSLDWLKQSNRSGQFLDPWNFIVKDKEAEKKFSFQLQRSLKVAASKKLLEGHSVFATPSVKPPPAEMKGIVENCGGQFLARELRGNDWPAQSFIISAPEDKKLCAKWKKASVPIVSAEVLLTGILQQKININDYLLKL